MSSPNLPLPTPRRGLLLGTAGWTAAATALVAVLVPVLNLLVPEGSPLHLSDYAVALVGKIMCYAICALAMDLIWGYTGILSLGHGLFFALGGYAMGMYLMRQIGRDGNYQSDLPDFMVFLDWKSCPGTGRCPTASWPSCCWCCWCPACWPSCSASSPSARASRACTSPSSRRP
jgi:urea transport system permease protein